MPSRQVTSSIFEADIEATFVPMDPPRKSWLALWSLNPAVERRLRKAPLSTESLNLILPHDGSVACKEIQVMQLPMWMAIDPLLAVHASQQDSDHIGQQPAGAESAASIGARHSSSVVAWSHLAAFCIDIIAQGKIQPAISTTGVDSWRLGPLDQSDTSWQAEMARSLPPTARATVSPESKSDRSPRFISASTPLVHAFSEAVADTFVRTSAAHVASGHQAFSSSKSTVIDAAASAPRLRDMIEQSGPPLVTLRIEPANIAADPEGFLGVLHFQNRVDKNEYVPSTTIWSADPAIRKSLHLAESALYRNLKRACRVQPKLKELLDQAHPHQIPLSESDVTDLCQPESVHRLALAGLHPTLPDGLFRSVDLNPIVDSAQESPLQGRPGRINLDDLVELRWRGSLDGNDLTEEELEALTSAKRSLVRLRGEWVQVSDSDRGRLTERTQLGSSAALAASLGSPLSINGELIDVEVVGPLADIGKRLHDRNPTLVLEAPTELQAELRPYQKRGLAWLNEMDELGLGGILADDMGLGKTLQILALHSHRQKNHPGPTLVICPASVVGNWERETKRFIPQTNIHRYHNSSRSLKQVQDGDVVITTYGIVRQDCQELSKVSWGLVVADEAQAIKNPYSRSAQAIRRISAETRFALTGTPIQNQLADLWALLDWTTPGLLGPLARFRREVASPIEKQGDQTAAANLNRQLRPFLLRRQKSDPDIAPELPPKTQTDEIVPLTAEQAALYKAVVSEVMAEIRESVGISRKGLVLRLLTQLKQVCNHPAQFLGGAGAQSQAAEALEGPTDQAELSTFSASGHTDQPPAADPAEDLASRSGKLKATTELLKVVREEGESSLVFTQYVAMGNLLGEHLSREGFTTAFLHGALSLPERDRLVAAFQAGETDVLVISLRAGGVGLNLTKASHVVHYDRWWNPAVEDQASDRAWRIGQQRPVQVHRMIAEGTVEDRIADLLQSKRQLADSIVGSGESWISDLDDEDLSELVTLSGEGVQTW